MASVASVDNQGQAHRVEADVLVIGGGPAGLAASACAAESGKRVVLVDDNPSLGGQIWRGAKASAGDSGDSALWRDRVRHAGVTVLTGTRVVSQLAPHVLLAERDGTGNGTAVQLRFQQLVLALGGRERFVPFEGWTLPNVMGVGGLQALVKGGMPIRDRSVVIAGTGPLLLAVAASLRHAGARVLLIAEQAPLRRLATFSTELLRVPAKLRQAISLQASLYGIPYLTGCYPLAAHGADGGQRLHSVTLRQGSRTWDLRCDYLATGFHLVPNTELAAMLGCSLVDGVVQVDAEQRTSQPTILCAGEATGIGGVELSLIEGQIAGYAASGQLQRDSQRAAALQSARLRWQRFASALNACFALRPELGELAGPTTIVCRCEDVRLGQLDGIDGIEGWRAAKLHTRCGMGPCQGRICGPILAQLRGWPAESIRPPVFPTTIKTLMADFTDR